MYNRLVLLQRPHPLRTCRFVFSEKIFFLRCLLPFRFLFLLESLPLNLHRHDQYSHHCSFSSFYASFGCFLVLLQQGMSSAYWPPFAPIAPQSCPADVLVLVNVDEAVVIVAFKLSEGLASSGSLYNFIIIQNSIKMLSPLIWYHFQAVEPYSEIVYSSSSTKSEWSSEDAVSAIFAIIFFVSCWFIHILLVWCIIPYWIFMLFYICILLHPMIHPWLTRMNVDTQWSILDWTGWMWIDMTIVHCVF